MVIGIKIYLPYSTRYGPLPIYDPERIKPSIAMGATHRQDEHNIPSPRPRRVWKSYKPLFYGFSTIVCVLTDHLFNKIYKSRYVYPHKCTSRSKQNLDWYRIKFPLFQRGLGGIIMSNQQKIWLRAALRILIKVEFL